VENTKNNLNPDDLEIFYNERKVKISELTDNEKIDFIANLWLQKEALENEKEVLQEMIQKMYFYGKMDNIQGESG